MFHGTPVLIWDQELTYAIYNIQKELQELKILFMNSQIEQK